MAVNPLDTLISSVDDNGVAKFATSETGGEIRTSQVNGYDASSDSMKTLSQGRSYLDLLPNDFEVPANTQVTVGSGSNYDVSATGAWILHPDIKRATAVQVYGNFTRSTQVKLYVAPIDNPDQNTPEFAYRGDGESEWMFKDKSGGAFAISFPACSRITPISANALKFYIRNEDASNAETLKLYIRLIF